MQAEAAKGTCGGGGEGDLRIGAADPIQAAFAAGEHHIAAIGRPAQIDRIIVQQHLPDGLQTGGRPAQAMQEAKPASSS